MAGSTVTSCLPILIRVASTYEDIPHFTITLEKLLTIDIGSTLSSSATSQQIHYMGFPSCSLYSQKMNEWSICMKPNNAMRCGSSRLASHSIVRFHTYASFQAHTIKPCNLHQRLGGMFHVTGLRQAPFQGTWCKISEQKHLPRTFPWSWISCL